jgi:hypothetical protein
MFFFVIYLLIITFIAIFLVTAMYQDSKIDGLRAALGVFLVVLVCIYMSTAPILIVASVIQILFKPTPVF